MSSHEGFSRILLESLYVGLYCIAYRIQGTEVMKEFDNLELIELNQIDKFVESIENYNETNDHSKNRQLIDEFYTSKVIASHFEKIYQRIGCIKLIQFQLPVTAAALLAITLSALLNKTFMHFTKQFKKKNDKSEKRLSNKNISPFGGIATSSCFFYSYYFS